MISNSLLQRVLLEPARKFRKLHIVSGFATAGMADSHMEHLRKENLEVSIDLIVGMTVAYGMQEAQHSAFRKLADAPQGGIEFQCRYVTRGNPVHVKSYVWLNDKGEPESAFCGSANYTMAGFGGNQIEGMASSDPAGANQFYERALKHTTDCRESSIRRRMLISQSIAQKEARGLEEVTLSLLDSKTKETPKRSGVNWGQRRGRNKNQAYINIPVRIGDGDFFPERHAPFTVHTDDGEAFIFVRAQDSGKGLHTTRDNSLLGAYLRKRLGVPSGEYVTKEHLEKHGRTDVTFFKIDDETYLLDFSANKAKPSGGY